MADALRIGWIGIGVMGLSMAGHLLEAGWPLTIHTRTKSKAEPLLAKGAQWADTPRAVAQASDAVFSIVSYPRDVEKVHLGENGVLEGLAPGGILCDMSTSSPALAEKIALAAQAKGCFALDAPVTGGDVGARQASLSIFVGGDKAAYARILPCLEKMGTRVLHCGEAGFGQKAKLANQLAVAGVTLGVCESFLFAQEAKLDVAQWMELVAVGAGGSVAMNTLGKRTLKGDFSPGFFIDHFVKDLGLCLEECRRMNLVLPCTELADELYRISQAKGYGSKGTHALLQCLAEMSNKEWHSRG
ncbi:MULTISPECIES: NAD(P)-dependent oxidoreductase [unclassified Desulfovibrio]|uniref:NAD(P)-dependent oxidoreductase n=1 Tax=unclassified Desulfovibrio TaxID=2593640 RepID=UPI000F5F7E1C|nr:MULTISPECIES: NAD(P)-dependent oxidoreductase [unclassified Desulfovibrio]RRD71906.1 NAD(P)-dependent oxidoreductase [Desulfovibrio sp. OH1209_COT-279]RRD88119.1 NAD(P)-dependent oxidoreductase [Desulfovibrio sp. OH1186_COT-070]